MVDNCCFGFCAVGQRYIDYGKNLANQLSKIVSGNIYVLTDDPRQFYSYEKIVTIRHTGEFSYHDKLLLFKEALLVDNNDCLICIDADTELLDYRTDIDFKNVDYGFYPEYVFYDDRICSMISFLAGKSDSINYGEQFHQKCLELNYNVDTRHFQESFMLLKESDKEKIKKFINVWSTLADFCNTQIDSRYNSVLGYGEGYSISVALKNAEIRLIEEDHPTQIHEFKRMLKHLRYEK